MTATVLLYIFVSFLAVYGVLCIIINIYNSVAGMVKDENKKMRVALLVKDQQDNIEGVVRSIFINDSLRKVMPKGNFIVLDMGSEDETLKILEKLKNDYQCFDIVKYNEIENLHRYFQVVK